MRERMGKERPLYREGSIQCTQGQAFKSARAITQGSRYLYRNATDEIIGAVNVTRIGRTYQMAPQCSIHSGLAALAA